MISSSDVNIYFGDKHLIFSASLLLGDNQPGKVEFSIGRWHVKLQILCIPNNNQNAQPELKTELVDDFLKIDLIGWNNSLGTATTQPLKFGEVTEDTTHTKRDAEISLWHAKLSQLNRIELFILVGGKSG